MFLFLPPDFWRTSGSEIGQRKNRGSYVISPVVCCFQLMKKNSCQSVSHAERERKRELVPEGEVSLSVELMFMVHNCSCL